MNIKSFTSVIIQTVSDKRAIQQLGRVIRNQIKTMNETKQIEIGKKPCYDTIFSKIFRKPTKFEPIYQTQTVKHIVSKVNDGNVNIYTVSRNVDEFKKLYQNLSNYDSTSECFNWTKHLDIKNGSMPKSFSDDYSEPTDIIWDDIDETKNMIIKTISDIISDVDNDNEFENFFNDNITDNDNDNIPDSLEFLYFIKDVKNGKYGEKNYIGEYSFDNLDKVGFLKKIFELIKQELVNNTFKNNFKNDEFRKSLLTYIFNDEKIAIFLMEHIKSEFFIKMCN